ncbi:hypothetical protein CC2G_009187 [Coprinopsis cinerea AmutBmut pab1-1]|nr:hypothetical protein CC2G_009187 [Coprinopsis cinerea AmutBmut pab1-1]
MDAERFEPITAERNTSGGYCLLILDGHNSHCTYLLSVLQKSTKSSPYAFRCTLPMLSSPAVVNEAACENIIITKATLLEHYSIARERAMKATTITAVFAKTRIWPLNADAIPSSTFKLALHTSTEAALTVPLNLPTLEPIPKGDTTAVPLPTPSAQTPSVLSATSTTSATSMLSTTTTSSSSTSSQQY